MAVRVTEAPARSLAAAWYIWLAGVLQAHASKTKMPQKLVEIAKVLSAPAWLARILVNLSAWPTSPAVLDKAVAITHPSFKAVWFTGGEHWKQPHDMTLLYIHGGAFFSGNAMMFHSWFTDLIAAYKKKTGKTIRICSVEYTLAGVQPCPYQHAEIRAAYEWLTKDLNIASSSIIVGGDSAGANLAAKFWLKTKAPIAGLVLISPYGDLVAGPDGVEPNPPTDYVTAKFAASGRAAYQADDRAESLIYHSPSDYKGAPQTLVTVGTGEYIAESIYKLVDILRKAEVQLTLVEGKNEPHEYIVNKQICHQQSSYTDGLDSLVQFFDKTVKSKK